MKLNAIHILKISIGFICGLLFLVYPEDYLASNIALISWLFLIYSYMIFNIETGRWKKFNNGLSELKLSHWGAILIVAFVAFIIKLGPNFYSIHDGVQKSFFYITFVLLTGVMVFCSIYTMDFVSRKTVRVVLKRLK